MATDASQRHFTELPPIPVDTDQLAIVLESESVSEVWVRRETEIFKFWIEYTDRYLAVEYRTDSSGSKPAWYRAIPQPKGEGQIGENVTDMLEEEDWKPVSEMRSTP
jgi:hypothetical protein